MKESKSFSSQDGFRLIKNSFALPQDISGFDRDSIHAIKICDLFLNGKLHLDKIVCLLHDDRGIVVQTLLKEGVIEERRKKRNEGTTERERRKVFACPN